MSNQPKSTLYMLTCYLNHFSHYGTNSGKSCLEKVSLERSRGISDWPSGKPSACGLRLAFGKSSGRLKTCLQAVRDSNFVQPANKLANKRWRNSICENKWTTYVSPHHQETDTISWSWQLTWKIFLRKFFLVNGPMFCNRAYLKPSEKT